MFHRNGVPVQDKAVETAFRLASSATYFVCKIIYSRGGEPSRHSGPHCTHYIFSGPHIRFMRKEQKSSTENLVESKKKVITTAEAQFFTQNQVKSKKRSSRPQAVV